MPEFGTSGVSTIPMSQGKEAEHGVYWIVREFAIRVPMRLHQTDLSDFFVPHDGMGSFPSSSFCHRFDLVQRLHPQGASQPLPSLLQQGELVSGHALLHFGEAGGDFVRAQRDDRTGGGRHALPQARLDGLRNRYAPRSADLQSRQTADQLGARLGRIDVDRPLSLLGSHQGLEPAHRMSLVSQSSGRNQGEEKRRRRSRRKRRTPTIAPGRNWRWN